MMRDSRLQKAFDAFDAYNEKDPHQENFQDQPIAKEVLYAMRMTEQLGLFDPAADEPVQLAARCQHIGRWEIPRSSYPMDRKGYLQWRAQLKLHHAAVAEQILTTCGYDPDTIEKVKFLVQKKQLAQNPETQLLEDVICLVFVHFYLDDFAHQHDDEKVIDILRKTLKKMSTRAIAEAQTLPLTEKIRTLIGVAAQS